MKILVTGSTGNLGRHVAQLLHNVGLCAVTYSHKNSLEDLDWENINCVVNCAAVIPSVGRNMPDYLLGNVSFLQNLLSYSKDKHFIHFSTFSELYRNDDYQQSKMLANSLLLVNSHIFRRLDIISLPTLDDNQLIESIVESDLEGNKPVVDKLLYNYISFSEVAEHVVDGLLSGIVLPITNKYREKNLYAEVCKRVSPSLIVEGVTVDRALNDNGVYKVCPRLLSVF